MVVVALAASAVALGVWSRWHGSRPGGAARRDACVYAGQRVSQLARFARAVGAGPACVSVFNNAAPDWDALERPWFVVHSDADLNWARWRRANPDRFLIITQSLVPGTPPADWRARGASGAYDAHARTLAHNLVRAGLGNSVIRLAPEANGTWNKDSLGDDPSGWADWRRYWRRFAAAMRTVPGADFRFDWTVNAGVRPIPFAAYYPGDDAVDVIGIDAYDFSPGALDEPPGPARWARQYRQPGGMAALFAFARARDKLVSIPEWGLAAAGHSGGAGDDPTYVDHLASVVRDEPVAYQAYFNATTNVGMLLTDAPRSLAAYRRHFGARGDATR